MAYSINQLYKAGAVTLLLGAFSASVLANGKMDRVVKLLELTPDQTASLQAFHAEHKEKKAARKNNRKEVKALLDAGDVDGAAALAAEQASARVYNMAKAKQALAKFLSDEQIEKLHQIKKRRMKNKAQKHFLNNA